MGCNDDSTQNTDADRQLLETIWNRIHGKEICISDKELVDSIHEMPVCDHTMEFVSALLFYHGIGVEKSLEDARRCMIQSADYGFLDAQFALAEAYDKGLFGKKDIFRAAKYYRKVADQGDVCASLCYAEACLKIYEETKIQFFAEEALDELWDKAYYCDDANLMLARCFMLGTAGEVSFDIAKQQIDYLESMGHDVEDLRRQYAELKSEYCRKKIEPGMSKQDSLDAFFGVGLESSVIRQRNLESYFGTLE